MFERSGVFVRLNRTIRLIGSMHFVYHEQRTWRCDMSVRERSWQASEARNNFPELMKRALAGAPQVVRHRSGQEVVVVSRVDYEARSEERLVGKECFSTCRSRWSQNH